MQGGEDPWPDRVKAQAFDAIALALKFSEHVSRSAAVPAQSYAWLIAAQ